MVRLTSTAVVLLLFCGGILPTTGLAAQLSCNKVEQTKVRVVVYDRAPRFSTTGGWVLGYPTDTLAAHSRIQVCESRTIGFIGGKRWLHIQFNSGAGPRDGWIFGEDTTVGSARAPVHPSLAALLFLPRIAQAQTPASAPEEVAGELLPPAFPVYALLFGALLIGIAAKGAYDPLVNGAPLALQSYLRHTAPALLVSPMVFLGFNSLASFEFDVSSLVGKTMLVYMCMAFQNGFFWQTVLAKVSKTITRETAAHPFAPRSAEGHTVSGGAVPSH
jgi:hypothetical protein